MKLSKYSQLLLVFTIGLLAATLMTACQIVTIDYVMVASSAGTGTSNNGTIDIYAVDSESGALRTGATSVSSGGVNPVSMAVSSDYANLYVANQGNSSLVHFAIAANGVVTQKDLVTLNSHGSVPVAIAVNAAHTFLYVVCADYPGPGGPVAGAVLTVFPLSNGTIGTPVANGSLSYWPLTVPGYPNDVIVPTGVTVLANNKTVYVTAFDQSAYNPGGNVTSNAHSGWVFGFSAGTGGVLTATSGSPYQAGVSPSAAAAEPTSRYLYVTDYADNQLIGYTIQDAGVLNFLIGGPFRAGNEPAAIVIDPRGKYIYVSNSLDSTVTAYQIDLSNGTPSTTVSPTGSAINSTDTQPVGITVDPALGRYVYTANLLGNSVSGFRLNPNTGALTPSQATPYPTGSKPTALVAIPHGNHSTQSITP